MADTLGTMCKAAELLMNSGAKSVRCIATHGVLSGKAFENLDKSVMTELLVSDTISPSKFMNDGFGTPVSLPNKLKYISCDNIIAKSIWGLVNKKSIHELNAI